jgi:DNA polymerase-3 subunit beta
MEVYVDRDTFHKGLQLIQNIVEPHQTLPILGNVLLEANGEGVRITATDLRIGAQVFVPAKVAKNGTTTISARKLLEIVRELPATELSVKVEESARIELRCGGATYKLVGLAPADFPPVEPGASLGWVSLDAKLLRQMLAQTSFAISHDESRYALNGVLISIQAGEIRLVATDGHRLALTSSPVPGASANAVGIVPRKAVQEVARVLGTGEEVQVALGENQFALKMPNFLLTARLIEGQFPNFEQVVPKGHPRRPVLSRSAFTAALRRVSVLSEERTKPVKLLLLPGTLKVTAYSPEMGEAEETIPAEYAGEEITIAFNSRYLLDALGPIEADQVVMELKDGLSPGVLKSAGSEGALCVIMPMRL